jgi:hypothetical protein
MERHFSCAPFVSYLVLVGDGNLVSFEGAVNDCFLSKTAKFCRKWLLPRAIPFAFNRAPVSGRRGSVFPPEVAHEVSVGRNPDLLQDLLDTEKRGAQHLFRFAQTKVFQKLGRSTSRLLFKEMPEARR